jgi:IMP dehydrogenase
METRIRPQEGLAFDDVLLVPRHSTVHPRQVDVATRLTREIALNVPFVSAAMDTVTEADMAIAMARLGGIGVVHKNLPIDRQAAEVDRVKRSESGMILDPITLPPDRPLREAMHLMARFKISGVPIVDGQRRLVGIITNRDLQFEDDLDRPIREVMTTTGLVTAPVGTTLDEAVKILARHKVEKLPVVDADGRLSGLITVKDVFKRRDYPAANKDRHGRLRVAAAVGASRDAESRAQALLDAGCDLLVVDSAHGHSEGVLTTIARLREAFPGAQLVGGNVATHDGACALVERGVDAVKVGVGPGSICTTRVVTGVGVPQVTAIHDAVEGAAGVPVIADGGIKFTGDAVKALAAGADSVMMGALLAGTEESPGESLLYEGRRYKVIRGMGSLAAMQEGSADRYFQEGEMSASKLVPEGIEGRVPYKGPVADVIFQLVGGLRSGMGYCGVATVRELHRCGAPRVPPPRRDDHARGAELLAVDVTVFLTGPRGTSSFARPFPASRASVERSLTFRAGRRGLGWVSSPARPYRPSSRKPRPTTA